MWESGTMSCSLAATGSITFWVQCAMQMIWLFFSLSSCSQIDAMSLSTVCWGWNFIYSILNLFFAGDNSLLIFSPDSHSLLSFLSSTVLLGHILRYDLDDCDDILPAFGDLVCWSNYILQTFAGVDPFVKTKLVPACTTLLKGNSLIMLSALTGELPLRLLEPYKDR